MTATWRKLGPIAWGGSVLSINVNANGRTWAATGGGLLALGDDGWEPVPGGPAQPGYVVAPGVNWWAGGMSGGLVSTGDSGHTWWEPWLDRVDEPITCIVPSPRWAVDRVMLAGTGGAGVLRSIDGGRRWLLSNFGLKEYTVLALTTATDWSHREYIFAGTLDGVYRSSGGGRGWKPSGLGGVPVQALAASDRYAENRLVMAGTEGAGLFCTTDGGGTWQPVGDALGREISVNAILRVRVAESEIWLAATDTGGLWRSEDGGLAWMRVYESSDPLLALSSAPDGGLLWAGAAEQGALASHDLGRTWTPDSSLCAWGFRRLLSPDGNSLLAWAPTGGVWRSQDGGARWERITIASHYEPVFAYLPLESAALHSRTEALLLRQGEDEIAVLETADAPIIALAADRSRASIWAADVFANIARSRDGGKNWTPVEIPWAGQQLLALVAADEDAIPVTATYDENSGVVSLWRRSGEEWERWLERPAQWPGAALATGGRRAEQTWAVIAGEVWASRGDQGWGQVAVPEDAGTVVGLAQRGGVRFLMAGRTLLRQSRDVGWESFPLPKAAAGPVDALLTADGAVLLLDAAGTLWRLEV